MLSYRSWESPTSSSQASSPRRVAEAISRLTAASSVGAKDEPTCAKGKLSAKLLSDSEGDEGVYGFDGYSRPSSFESEGDNDGENDGDDSQPLNPKSLVGPTEQRSRDGPEASRRAWMKKVRPPCDLFPLIMTSFCSHDYICDCSQVLLHAFFVVKVCDFDLETSFLLFLMSILR